MKGPGQINIGKERFKILTVLSFRREQSSSQIVVFGSSKKDLFYDLLLRYDSVNLMCTFRRNAMGVFEVNL